MIQQDLVSIVIPCYNGEGFIAQTLSSVFQQTYQNFEVILVNDGSTDLTEEILRNISDIRMTYILKNNSGVSDSRNLGFEKSKGEYILFLDYDDILAVDFLEKRVNYLKQNPDYDFCCGLVKKIDEEGNLLPGLFKGAALNILFEILAYYQNVISCPSGYIIKSSFLIKNELSFDSQLSSTADRYYLLQLSLVGKCGLINEPSFLYYRIHKHSMSNKFNKTLLLDNANYMEKVKKMKNIPDRLKKYFLSRIYYILAIAFLKLNNYFTSLIFIFKTIIYSPYWFIHHNEFKQTKS